MFILFPGGFQNKEIGSGFLLRKFRLEFDIRRLQNLMISIWKMKWLINAHLTSSDKTSGVSRYGWQFAKDGSAGQQAAWPRGHDPPHALEYWLVEFRSMINTWAMTGCFHMRTIPQ